MTADQVKGKGFKGALGYNLDKVAKDVAKVLTSTFNKENDLKAILKEVSLVRMQRPNLAKYFYHTSLNFPTSENLKDEQMKTIAADYLKRMGFGNNQHVIFRHFDADHPHLHILVNRIGYDGSVVSDSQDYKRSEQVLRQLEKKYQLTEVIGSKQAQERAMTKNEWEMMKHTNKPSAKMKIQEAAKGALKDKPSIEVFIQRLEKENINVLFNQASTGFVSGISYGYEGLQFKGAQLGNAYKWQAIKTATGYEQERDRTTVHEANIRTGKLKAQRAAATAGATTGANETNRNGKGRSHAEDDRGSLHQGTGQLQTHPEQRSRQKPVYDTGIGGNNNQYGLSATNGSGQLRNAEQGTEQSGQQVAHQGVRDSNLIGHLLGADNDTGHLAEIELSNNRRRRKKKRRGLSH
ncbi:relaxase/mobilization nuclease domain-containing protein [Mucilaginibacter aquatilis]|uniref:Relaxase/mobilization nuclease domain-containing protein n=1 Tax=Mucilaginibacter aquatilis TaxID=1517760 RepID=A0A6I4IH32_9SPHI|nr:relaxase/mobilization nuclease domain-containing protein [Mucilaginibacter aquatilis]MVN92669.1 relaxase/mobilization nuclease domain-containing protein [Mucilaginibacter aquatilis]